MVVVVLVVMCLLFLFIERNYVFLDFINEEVWKFFGYNDGNGGNKG